MGVESKNTFVQCALNMKNKATLGIGIGIGFVFLLLPPCGGYPPEHEKAEKKEAKAEAPIATEFKNQKDIEKEIKRVRKLMEKAAKNLEFIEAAGFRDQMRGLQKLEKKFKK